MNFSSDDDVPDEIKKLLENLTKQLENIPGFGEMFKSLMNQFQAMDPQQLEEALKKMLGGATDIDLSELMKNGTFSFFPISNDPQFMEKFQEMMKNYSGFVNVSYSAPPPAFDDPYFEMLDNADHVTGQILVELPGIKDLHQIFWEVKDGAFRIHTLNDNPPKYKKTVPLERPIQLQNHLATIKNGVFSLPFKYLDLE